MSIKNNLIIISILLLVLPAQAQYEGAILKYSIKDCIAYGISASPKLKNILLDEQIQESQNNQVVGIAYPQAKVTAQLQYLPIVPKQRAAADAFDFGSSLSFFKIDTPAYIAYQQQPKKKYTELQFGLPINSGINLQVTQILFDAGVLIAFQARNTLTQLSVLNTKRTEEQLKIDITKAYYNCVIANKRYYLLQENINLLNKIVSQTNTLYKEGFAEKIDADRLTVQRNNLLIEQQKVEALIELSFSVLKFQMGMPLETKITLSDEINEETFKDNLMLENTPNYEMRNEVQVLETIKKLNQFDYKRYKNSILPSAALFGSAGYNTQTSSFGDLFKYSWFFNTALGLNVSVGLFDGFQRKNKMQEVQLKIQKNENDIDAFKKVIDFETQNAKTQLKNSLLSSENSKKNMQLAERVYSIALIKYKEGLGTNIEIIQAQTALKEAQTNYYGALYDAMIAKIDLQKSLGLFK